MVLKALNTNDVMEHLRAFMEVAGHHHNSRSVRNGYNASAEYIIHQLENSGACDLTIQSFPVSAWEKIQNTEFIVLTASGDVVVFKDQQDFTMLKSAAPSTLLFDNRLIEMGDLCNDSGCSNAVENKIVIVPYSQQVEENIAIARHLMKDDYLVNIQTHVVITTSHTYNIICEWKYGDDSNRIVVGSHLDSVDNSPGINAGSGAATTLAIALALSSLRYQPTNKLVFAWWGAKEAGDSGILHYLNSLNDEQVSNTAAHINIDIIGSQNYIPYVLRTNPTSEQVSDQSRQIVSAIEQYFDRIQYKYAHTFTTDGTEHDIFATRTGIPYGGLYSGMGPKTPSQKRKFGGIAYVKADPCYHLACDTLDNVSVHGINLFSHAAIYAIHALSSHPNLRRYLDGKSSL
ncbi:hypothetical protein Unana1_00155 [Umbelopsis nana]